MKFLVATLLLSVLASSSFADSVIIDGCFSHKDIRTNKSYTGSIRATTKRLFYKEDVLVRASYDEATGWIENFKKQNGIINFKTTLVPTVGDGYLDNLLVTISPARRDSPMHLLIKYPDGDVMIDSAIFSCPKQ